MDFSIIEPNDFEHHLNSPHFLIPLSVEQTRPAQGFGGNLCYLNSSATPNPSVTYFITVNSHTLKDSGLFCGDRLVVDRSIKARHGNLVVIDWNGEFTLARLTLTPNSTRLAPCNPNIGSIRFDNNREPKDSIELGAPKGPRESRGSKESLSRLICGVVTHKMLALEAA